MPSHNILIADSGSTKTDWMLVSTDGGSELHRTVGLNPFIIDCDRIAGEVRENLLPALGGRTVGSVHFYGTGCSSDRNRDTMLQALRRNFPDSDITVDHDMTGAAKALCGRKPGIACILGTGSNACVYDGERVVDGITSPGYILGDEGSGNHLGKALIRAYCYRALPEDLDRDMRGAYGDASGIIAQLYDSPTPNAYLASFTRFLSARKGHPYVEKLAADSFHAFVKWQVTPFGKNPSLPLHFTGSISHYFSDILARVLEENGMRMGRIVRKPIEGLKEYHLSFMCE